MANRSVLTFLGAAWLSILFAACGPPKNLVVLAPDPDGTVGRITVASAAGSVDIDSANQFTTIKDRNTLPSQPAEISPSKIQEIFGSALAVRPPVPLHFLLYFKPGSVELLPESTLELAKIPVEIKTRGADMISVVGHSDTAGEKAYNLKLSTRRAEAVKSLLVEMGLASSLIEVASHGEENLLVKTADNVKNEKNRRVEVVVR